MKRNKFSLSHYHLTTANMGYLVPIGLMEVLPGDTFQQATSLLLRCAPLVTPPMHPVNVRVHHWFVPHRLVWEEFEDFITGGPTGEDGDDEAAFPEVNFTAGQVTVFSLANWLGLPLNPDADNLGVSALPFRGYNLIYNEWYRDQDLSPAQTISLASGTDTTTNKSALKVAWEKDYFTTSRPWEQKGPSVPVPVQGSAPVDVYNDLGGVTTTLRHTASGADSPVLVKDALSVPSDLSFWADMSSLTDGGGDLSVGISELRRALALQRFEEARARWGSRYTEYLRYYGVKSSDARLQRPEYLGGGKQTIQFSEVLSTNFDSGTANPGQFGGHGIAAMRSNRYRRFFEEHGYVFTLMSVLPKTIYANSLDRTWLKRTKYEFWTKELEHIGQQEVQLAEVMANCDEGTGPGKQQHVFGYQDRYDEYRRKMSRVSGEFLDSTLDTWHFARNFASGSEPTLNDAFISATPSTLPFADQEASTLYVMANHNVQARRLVSSNATSYIK